MGSLASLIIDIHRPPILPPASRGRSSAITSR